MTYSRILLWRVKEDPRSIKTSMPLLVYGEDGTDVSKMSLSCQVVFGMLNVSRSRNQL